jgi:hypothetical protein
MRTLVANLKRSFPSTSFIVTRGDGRILQVAPRLQAELNWRVVGQPLPEVVFPADRTLVEELVADVLHQRVAGGLVPVRLVRCEGGTTRRAIETHILVRPMPQGDGRVVLNVRRGAGGVFEEVCFDCG